MIITIDSAMENDRNMSRAKGGIGRIMTPKIVTTAIATMISPRCFIKVRKFILQ
jgi:hypothetical protein